MTSQITAGVRTNLVQRCFSHLFWLTRSEWESEERLLINLCHKRPLAATTSCHSSMPPDGSWRLARSNAATGHVSSSVLQREIVVVKTQGVARETGSDHKYTCFGDAFW